MEHWRIFRYITVSIGIFRYITVYIGIFRYITVCIGIFQYITVCIEIFRYTVYIGIFLYFGKYSTLTHAVIAQVWWLIISTACVGTLPDGPFKQRVNHATSIMSFNFLSRCISMVITYHDGEINRPKNGICVANHTSPIDVLVLMCDNCYSLVSRNNKI